MTVSHQLHFARHPARPPARSPGVGERVGRMGCDEQWPSQQPLVAAACRPAEPATAVDVSMSTAHSCV